MHELHQSLLIQGSMTCVESVCGDTNTILGIVDLKKNLIFYVFFCENKLIHIKFYTISIKFMHSKRALRHYVTWP